MVSITLGPLFSVIVALLGAVLIYRDGRSRGMETADMWAVGFFVAFFLLPIIGGLIVVAFYLSNRDGGGPRSHIVPKK
jgi:asparagine N-glycosylation enzyme membrane subunit Stt3